MAEGTGILPGLPAVAGKPVHIGHGAAHTIVRADASGKAASVGVVFTPGMLDGWRDTIFDFYTADGSAALAERAVAMARAAPEDKFAGLADAKLLAREFPNLELIDQALPGFLGVNKSEYRESSMRLFLTSTQPKHSASSCASLSVRDALRGLFL